MAAPNKTFKVGVIGYGLSAKVFHIPFIAATPSLELHSILQRSPKPPADSAPADHPQLAHYTELASFLADPELDVVVLSTPPQTHFAFAQQALQAGKHVFVEKPFVPTSAEADQLIELAKAAGRLICVYQNRRWDVDFLTVKQLLAEGTLGRIVEFSTHFDRYRLEKPTNWKGSLTMDQGGGAIYDLGTHLIDQVYELFGMPKGVFAKLVNQRDGQYAGSAAGEEGVEPDGVTAQLFYGDGLLVHVRISVVSVEAQQPRYWIRGVKGSYHKAGLDPQEGQLRAGGKITDAGFGVETPEWYGTLTTLEDGKPQARTYPTVPPVTYAKIYELFAKALQSGRDEDIPVSAKQASDVLKIIEAARESARTGREVPLTSSKSS